MDTWATVGKAATALATLATAVSLYRIFFAKRHKVSLRIKVIEECCPDISEKIGEFLHDVVPNAVLFSSDELRSQYSSDDGFHERLSATANAAAVHAIDRAKFERRLKLPRELVRVELKNSGQRSARSIVIDIGFDVIIFESNSSEVKREGKIFRMAELRPGQKVVLNLWRDYGYGCKVSATHEDHEVRQQRVEEAIGWRAVVVDYLLQPYSVFFFVAGAWLVWIMLGVLRQVGWVN